MKSRKIKKKIKIIYDIIPPKIKEEIVFVREKTSLWLRAFYLFLKTSKYGFTVVFLMIILGGAAVWAIVPKTQTKIIAIYPTQVSGDITENYSEDENSGWQNLENALGSPNVLSNANADFFSKENSANYKTGPFSLILSDFMDTGRDVDLEELADDEFLSAKINFSFALGEENYFSELEVSDFEIIIPEKEIENPEDSGIDIEEKDEIEKDGEEITGEETTDENIEYQILDIEKKEEKGKNNEESGEEIIEIEEIAEEAVGEEIEEIVDENIEEIEIEDSESLEILESKEPEEEPVSFQMHFKDFFDVPFAKAQEDEEIENYQSETGPPRTEILEIEEGDLEFGELEIEKNGEEITREEIVDEDIEKEIEETVEEKIEENIFLDNLDTKIIIWYSLDDDVWQQLDIISGHSLSNALNNGYFNYEALFVKNWEDLSNLKIKFEGVVGGEANLVAYLDSVWIDVEYEEREEEEEEKSEESEITIISSEKDFKMGEEPEFRFKYKKEKEDILTLAGEALGIIDYWDGINLTAEIISPDKKVLKIPSEGFNNFSEIFTLDENGEISIKLKNNKKFKPGLYKIILKIEENGNIQILEQDFTWGVLAINVNKSIYLPGEESYLQMGVLRNDGHTICDANLVLSIKYQVSSVETILSTEDGTIQYSGKCDGNNVTDTPDYFAYYTTGDAGVYEMKLTNLDNGYEITDSFEVRESVPFDVERIGPTRIYPPADYEMVLKVKANEDSNGEIIETVPGGFVITNVSFVIAKSDSDVAIPLEESTDSQEGLPVEQAGSTQSMEPTKIHDSKFMIQERSDKSQSLIFQNVSLKQNDELEIKYTFDAPDVSPYIYLLGPLEIGDWQEIRQWQIASDTPTYDTKDEDAESAVHPRTLSIDLGDTADLLVVSLTIKGGPRTGGSPTYNLVTMTQAGTAQFSGDEGYAELWYMLAPPTSGSLQISVPNTGTDEVNIVASSYISSTGVFAFDTFNQASATSTNPTVTVTTNYDGAVIVDSLFSGYKDVVDGNNRNLLFQRDTGQEGYGAQYYLQSTKGDAVMSWTQSSDCWATVAASFYELPVITVSGNAYADEAATVWANCDHTTPVNNISLVIDGTSIGTTSCNAATGAYSFSNVTVAVNNPVSVFFNATDKGVAATVATDSTTAITLNPRKNIVWVETEGAVANITNTNLDHCDSASPAECANIPYAVATANLTVESGIELHVEDSKTYAPGGTVTTQGAGGNLHLDDNSTINFVANTGTISGDVNIDAGATLIAPSSTLTIAGNYTNNGIFTHNDGTVTFNAGDTGNTLAGTMITTSSFYDLVFNNAAGAWSFSNPATVANDFTITASETVTSGVTAPSGALIITGNYANTAGRFTHNDGTVTFNAGDTGNTLAGTMNGSSSFNKIKFNGSGGSWTIQDAMKVSAANAADTFVIGNGTVTLGDGGGDNLEINGRMTIAATSGQTGTFQTMDGLAQGNSTDCDSDDICIDVNNNTAVDCDNCIIQVGTTGADSGQGNLKIRENALVRLNPFTAASDTGIEVEKNGYLEIQGSQDDTGTATGTDTHAIREAKICANESWSDDGHNNKHVRMTSGLAIGKIYTITDTIAPDTECLTDTDDSISRTDNTSDTDTDPTTSGGACSGTGACTVNVAETLVVTDNDHIGRYIHNLTDDKYYLIVDSDENAQDTITIVTDNPDAFTTMGDGDDIEVTDGIKATDTFEILDYAHITAENGTACGATINQSFESYIHAKQDSETNIQYADICNLGRNAANKYGVSFYSVDGSQSNEGVTVDKSRVHGVFRGIYFDGSSNNILSSNQSYGNFTSGIYLVSSSNNILSSNQAYSNSANGIYIATSSNNNILSSNQAYSNTFYGIYIVSSSNNNILYSNQAYGNSSYGIPLAVSSNNNILSSNQAYGNSSHGIYIVNSSNNNILSSNQAYSNPYGLYKQHSSGTIIINDNYGGSGANSTADIYFNDSSSASTARCHNCVMASTTEVVADSVSYTGAYLISSKHDTSNGSTKIWGEYSVADEDSETPQIEATNKFNYADNSWADSITDPGYSGTGTKDETLSLGFNGAMAGANSAYSYFINLKTASAQCDGLAGSAVFDVYRDAVDVDDVYCGEAYTDATTNVQFTINQGGTAYVVGDTYTFVAFKASANTNEQKTITMMQDGDKFTAGSGETVELKGQGAGTNLTTVTRKDGAGGSGGYHFDIAGTIDAQYYSFDYLGGTGGGTGLDLQSTATITNIADGTFANFVNVGATDTYLNVHGDLIGTGSPAKTFANISFTETSNDVPEYTVTVANGTPSNGNYWLFDTTATCTGWTSCEDSDSDSGDGAASPNETGFARFTVVPTGITVDGVIYSDEESTPYLCSTTGNLTVDVRVNGLGSYTAECTADTGAFSVADVIIDSASDVVTIFINENGAGSVYATTVTKALNTTSGITANLFQNHVIIRHEDGGPMTIDNLANFDFVNDNDVQFTAENSTPDTLVVNDGHELYILAGDVFTPGGNVTVDDIKILGTYTATGSEAITVSGNWVNSGTFTASTSTVTFDGSALQTITSGGSSFNNIIFNNSLVADPNINYTGALSVGSNVTLSDTTRIASTDNTAITISGTIDGANILTINSGSGAVTLSGTIGGTTGVTSIDFDGATITVADIGDADTVGVTGATDINGTTDVIFTGTTYKANQQTYTSAAGSHLKVNGAAATTFTSSDDAIAFTTADILLADGSDLTVTSAGGAITALTINGTSSEDVTLTSTGGTTNTISVGVIGTADGINTVALEASVSTTLTGNITTSNAAGNTVTATGPILLGAGVTVDTDTAGTDGNISFSSTVNSADATDRALTLTAGSADITVSGAIGGTNDLASLTITGNDITLANIGGGSSGVTGATSATGDTTGAITLTGTIYNTAGTQDYDAGGAARTITLNDVTTFTTTDDTIGFTGLVDSQAAENNAITLNAGTAQVTFNNNIGASQSIGLLTKQGSGDLLFGSSTLTCTGITLSAGTINTAGTDSGAWTSTGDVTISSGTLTSTSATLTVGGNWDNNGTFTCDAGTVTFNASSGDKTITDGGSAFNNIKFDAGATSWTYTDEGTTVATNSTELTSNVSGTVNFINARTGNSPTVTSGTLNVDWYLGIHAVNAAATATNIDTGNADITISENSSPAEPTVWRYNSGSWGTAGTAWETPATSKTTGTNADGKNPQFDFVGSIRIREYSNAAGVLTHYYYNLRIDWQTNYGQYDYYEDYGEEYLTSCLKNGATCDNDTTVSDDIIGASWHRAAPVSSINSPYTCTAGSGNDCINEPPDNGSWYIGMLTGLSFTIDDYTIDFGAITPGADPTDDQTNTLSVTTSTTNGYVINAWATAMACSDAGSCGAEEIADYGETNSDPGTWTTGAGFGYSTNDTALLTGTAGRFSGPKYAGFIHTGGGELVADRSGTECPCLNEANIITYRLASSNVQRAGPYQATIVYILTVQY